MAAYQEREPRAAMPGESGRGARTAPGTAGTLQRWMYRNERWMYEGSRPNAMARVLNRVWAAVGSSGLGRNRLVTLDVAGRRTGRRIPVPLIVADVGGERYLCAMLGERADWVANVRAAGGGALLRGRRPTPVRLEEVDPAGRAPIVRRHLAVAPAARSFLPDPATAAPGEFERAASEIPVFRIQPVPGMAAPAPGAAPVAESPKPGSRRRRRRVVLAGVAMLLVATVATLVAFGTSSGPAAFALPAGAMNAPRGALDGRWTVAPGSLAGFRVEQLFLGMRSDVVGRTDRLTGSAEIAGGRLTAASFVVDLTSLAVNGKVPPQVALSLGTADRPDATIELARPLDLPSALADGAAMSLTADATLSLRGVARPVTVQLAVRGDGATIEAAGSMPVAFADWGIVGPAGYGPLGSLADRGVAEFLLTLHRSGDQAGG